jgi:transcription initiation factor IIE alpha subunit
MIEQEQEPQMCYECDEEFVVHSSYDTQSQVSFCPFCGSEMDITDEDADEVDSDDDEWTN